jgi:hypothetical protein
MPLIGDSMVLVPTPWCVSREQEQAYLVYNPHTDEMHLIPPEAHYVYRLCDGLRSVGDICRSLVAAGDPEPVEFIATLRDFLAGLVERGVLEVENEG